MYCVKCRKKTNTTSEKLVTTTNNRTMKRGKCSVCGTTKTQFVKSPEGGSILNKMINSLPVEMHLLGHNFTGPGTKLNKRLNPFLYNHGFSRVYLIRTITAFNVSTLSVQSRLFTYLPYSNNHGFSRVPFSTLKNRLFRRCLK